MFVKNYTETAMASGGKTPSNLDNVVGISGNAHYNTTRYWIITKLSIPGLKENKGQCQEPRANERERGRKEKGGEGRS